MISRISQRLNLVITLWVLLEISLCFPSKIRPGDPSEISLRFFRELFLGFLCEFLQCSYLVIQAILKWFSLKFSWDFTGSLSRDFFRNSSGDSFKNFTFRNSSRASSRDTKDSFKDSFDNSFLEIPAIIEENAWIPSEISQRIPLQTPLCPLATRISMKILSDITSRIPRRFRWKLFHVFFG